MSHIEGEIRIERAIEEVFDFVANERNEPLYNPRMLNAVKVTDGPIGIGTQFTATTKTGGRTADMVIEVTAFDRPTRRTGSRAPTVRSDGSGTSPRHGKRSRRGAACGACRAPSSPHPATTAAPACR